jgi:hypothetical protein
MPPASLDVYFPTSDAQRHSYSQQDLADIQQLLRSAKSNLDKRWASNPKLYIILRTIGQLSKYKQIGAHGITDDWLPLTSPVLKLLLAHEHRSRFIQVQSTVMTAATTIAHDLEAGSVVQQHVHIDTVKILPVEDVSTLSEGSCASVQHVKTKTDKHYTIKRFPRRHLREEKLILKSFVKEVQAMRAVQHPHCLQLVRNLPAYQCPSANLRLLQMVSYTSLDHYGLIMSPYAEYNLEEYYDQVLADSSQRAVLRTFFGCLAHALAYLHNTAHIRHKNIKPANILVKHGRVYLADFGIAHDWHGYGASTNADAISAFVVYCAPELSEPCPKKKNAPADVWSLGCVFLEMYTVLKGRSIDQLRLHLDTDTHFQDIPAVGKWIRHLERYSSLPGDGIISSWIGGMLCEDIEQRVSSSLLWQQISSADSASYPIAPKYTCGTCLQAELANTKLSGHGPSTATFQFDTSADSVENGVVPLTQGAGLEQVDEADSNENASCATMTSRTEECPTATVPSARKIDRQKLWPTPPTPQEPFEQRKQDQNTTPATHLLHESQRRANHDPKISMDSSRPSAQAIRQLNFERGSATMNFSRPARPSFSSAMPQQRSHSMYGSRSGRYASQSRVDEQPPAQRLAPTPLQHGQGRKVQTYPPPSLARGPFSPPDNHSVTSSRINPPAPAPPPMRRHASYHAKWQDSSSSTPAPTPKPAPPRRHASFNAKWQDSSSIIPAPASKPAPPRRHASYNARWNEPSSFDRLTVSPFEYADDKLPLPTRQGTLQENEWDAEPHQKAAPLDGIHMDATRTRASVGQRMINFVKTRLSLSDDPKMLERVPKKMRGPRMKW